MREIGEWLTNCLGNEELSRLGVIESDEEEGVQGNGWVLAWIELAKEWEKRMKLLGDDACGMYFPDYAPSNMFAMFDMWQEWLQPSFFVGTSMWTEQ
jgi:glycine/D-amino acid oxidase-like deaminating enzyme